MTAVAQLFWRDGTLWSESPGCPARAWVRPADLAQARLGTDPAVGAFELADGRDLLTAAFAVVPIVCGPLSGGSQLVATANPLPDPAYGEAVTPAARAAFRVFLGLDGAGDDFRVMRGEPDDFLVFARRTGATWQVGGFTVEATTLTVRFEDVWDLTPPELRTTSYAVNVLRDGEDAILPDIAPDARIFIDLAANGGFLLTFTPADGAT
ncbi:MAG: glycoside hydrolase family 97 C-terminal domain-containing protein [Kiritimatiellae bacterium]|nr:glycoside hydrolase family 97 C-terminal domain-containing protein [Kiritimatiellia bacterium]